MKKIQKGRGSRRGQGMTEYIIIVALIAIGAIGVVTLFGNNIRALFGTSTTALAGEDREVGAKASEDKFEQKDITSFGQENATAGGGGDSGGSGRSGRSGR